MDEPPSPSSPGRGISWFERLRVRCLVVLPGNARKRVKKMLNIADKWSRAGHFSEADKLYQQAAALARESGSLHLRKKAHKRRADLLERRLELSEMIEETDRVS